MNVKLSIIHIRSELITRVGPEIFNSSLPKKMKRVIHAAEKKLLEMTML